MDKAFLINQEKVTKQHIKTLENCYYPRMITQLFVYQIIVISKNIEK